MALNFSQFRHRFCDALRKSALVAQNRLPTWHRGHVLISGAPRTGTSALCYWLRKDPRIVSFYESRILVAVHRMLDEVDRFRDLNNDRETIVPLCRQMALQYYASQRVTWGRILVEKEPLELIAFPDGRYLDFIGHMEELFPEIKFIFMVRSADSVVWSMTQRQWGQSRVDIKPCDRSIEEACTIVRRCNEVIAEYKGRTNVCVCEYENLVSNPEVESRRIYEFLGLRFQKSFVPRSASQLGFSESELEYIRGAVGKRH